MIFDDEQREYHNGIQINSISYLYSIMPSNYPLEAKAKPRIPTKIRKQSQMNLYVYASSFQFRWQLVRKVCSEIKLHLIFAFFSGEQN